MDKYSKCDEFLNKLLECLNTSYFNPIGREWKLIKSCNNDKSVYLVMDGDEDEITYSSKPSFSFRLSDHWNWFANLKKNEDPFYIQCNSLDMPYPRYRHDNKSTQPRFGVQVCITYDGEHYICIYGESYDRHTKKWSWVDNTPESVAGELHAYMMRELY